MAKQSLKISLSFNDKNLEAFNNMAVLDMKDGLYEQAKNGFENACKTNEFLYEPFYNLAAIKYNQGEHEEAYKYANLSVEKAPNLFETKELLSKIQNQFN